MSVPARAIVALLAAAIVVGWASSPPATPPMATFNIENFPRGPRQPAAAAREIGKLGVSVVALQEIRSPEKLLQAVHEELGLHWVYVTHTGSGHRVGLLVDRRAHRVARVHVHDEVKVIPGGRPALEVELRDRIGWATQSVFVVHLKSGRGGESVRRAQLQALAPIVAARRQPATVLGDFNPVSTADRRALDHFAIASGLGWRTAHLRCTAYFADGRRCRGVALDHVMSSAGGTVRALGACATDGCEPGDRCPTWVGEVSDHCPVRFSPRRPRSLPTAE